MENEKTKQRNSIAKLRHTDVNQFLCQLNFHSNELFVASRVGFVSRLPATRGKSKIMAVDICFALYKHIWQSKAGRGKEWAIDWEGNVIEFRSMFAISKFCIIPSSLALLSFLTLSIRLSFFQFISASSNSSTQKWKLFILTLIHW